VNNFSTVIPAQAGTHFSIIRAAPTPEARLLRSMQEQAAAQRKLLG
jgi:hypothetical protein